MIDKPSDLHEREPWIEVGIEISSDQLAQQGPKLVLIMTCLLRLVTCSQDASWDDGNNEG